MNRRRKLGFSILAMALFLGLGEGLARLWPGGDTAGAESALRFDANPELQDGSQRFWRRDPMLFWRMRPHLDVDFGGMRLRTNAGGFRDGEHHRDPGAFTIAFVGDSTTFGWGVQDPAERFSDRTPQLVATGGDAPVFGAATGGPPSVRVRGLNFGQTGYSTVQAGRLLAREVLPLAPDVVVLMLGANDYSRASGRIDDQQPVAGANTTVAGVRHLFSSSALYRRSSAALTRLRDGDGGPEDDLLRRVPPELFREHLTAMVESVRESGAVPILMTYPRRPLNPLLECPSIAQGEAERLTRRDRHITALGESLQMHVNEALGGGDDALAVWETIGPEHRDHPSYHYGRGYLLFRANRQEAADTALRLAMSRPLAGPDDCAVNLFATALFRYREEPAAARYDAIIHDVAAVTGALLIDARARLVAAQESIAQAAAADDLPPSALLSRWFGPDSYFVDVVHPSARGHALLAEALAVTVRDVMRGAESAGGGPLRAGHRPR